MINIFCIFAIMKETLFLLAFGVLSSCTYNELIPVCEPDEKIFSDLVLPIIESNCMGCHSEYSNRQAVLGTYDGVIDALNNHSLIDRVVSGSMPPYGFPVMSSEDITILKEWACE